MIFIVDNGRDYSDHQIYFVEADNEADVILAVRRSNVRTSWGTREIIGAAPTIDWRAPSSAISLRDFIESINGEPLQAYDLELYMGDDPIDYDLLPENMRAGACINFDGMTDSDLRVFVSYNGDNKALPESGQLQVKYARLLIDARALRLSGDIEGAMTHELQASHVYLRLPKELQW